MKQRMVVGGSSVIFLLAVGANACTTSSDAIPPDAGGIEGSVEAAALDGASPDGPGGPTPDGGPLTVSCTHPGKGNDLGNGTCECPVPIDMTGTWSGLYDCKSLGANTCFDRDKAETFTITQTGNFVKAVSDGTFVMEGTLCGNVWVWTGGPTTGEYVECGTLTLVDANHYTKESCYQNSDDGGAVSCNPSFETGCVGQSGICTNTGARQPEAAPAITNPLCKSCNPTCP